MSTEFYLANTPTGVAHRILTAHPTVFRLICGQPALGAAAGQAGLSDLIAFFSSFYPSPFSIALGAFCGLTWLVFLEGAIGLASLAKVSFEEGRA